MKYLYTLWFATLLTACGNAPQTSSVVDVEGRSRDVANYPALVNLLSLMGEAASEGPSLAYFGYQQNFWYDGDIQDCKQSTGIEVATFFQAYVDAIFAGGGWENPDDRIISQGLAEFNTLIGNDDYYHCQKGEAVFMGWNDHHYLIGRNGAKVRLQLTAGYED